MTVRSGSDYSRADAGREAKEGSGRRVKKPTTRLAVFAKSRRAAAGNNFKKS